jgi:hypothetical protein
MYCMPKLRTQRAPSLKVSKNEFLFSTPSLGMKNMIGRTISHYQILEKIRAAERGVVHKAEDTKRKRAVALKFGNRNILPENNEDTP